VRDLVWRESSGLSPVRRAIASGCRGSRLYDRGQMRARGAATVITAALLLAGCGSSKSSSSTSSSSSSNSARTATAGQRVSGRDGGFTTILPTGFTDATQRANTGTVNIQFAASAAPANGFATNINVIRSQVRAGTDISQLTDRELAVLRKQLPSAHQFSRTTSTTVAGQPARELDYIAAPLRRVQLHIRQVFVVNNSFAYTITYTALPSTYSSQLSALDQVLSAWRWT